MYIVGALLGQYSVFYGEVYKSSRRFTSKCDINKATNSPLIRGVRGVKCSSVMYTSNSKIYHNLERRKFNVDIRRFTTFAFVLTIVALIVGFSACDQIQQTSPSFDASDGISPWRNSHWCRSTTDGSHSPSPYGLPMQRGFELAREEINNSGQLGDAKITFIAEDDQGTAENAVEAYNKLIHQDGVPLILGPANSSQVREAFPIAQQNRVVAISSLSSASGLSAIGDFNFRISLTTDMLVPSGIQDNSGKTWLYRGRYDI